MVVADGRAAAKLGGAARRVTSDDVLQAVRYMACVQTMAHASVALVITASRASYAPAMDREATRSGVAHMASVSRGSVPANTDGRASAATCADAPTTVLRKAFATLSLVTVRAQLVGLARHATWPLVLVGALVMADAKTAPASAILDGWERTVLFERARLTALVTDFALMKAVVNVPKDGVVRTARCQPMKAAPAGAVALAYAMKVAACVAAVEAARTAPNMFARTNASAMENA